MKKGILFGSTKINILEIYRSTIELREIFYF